MTPRGGGYREVSKSKGLFSLFAQVPKPLRRLNAIDERGNHPALLLKHISLSKILIGALVSFGMLMSAAHSPRAQNSQIMLAQIGGIKPKPGLCVAYGVPILPGQIYVRPRSTPCPTGQPCKPNLCFVCKQDGTWAPAYPCYNASDKPPPK